MDQGTMVSLQFAEGTRLLDRLEKEAIEVSAAAWIKEYDSGNWILYLVTPLVTEEDLTGPGFKRIHGIVRQMRKEGIWIDPNGLKVVPPSDPLAKAVIAEGN